MWIILYLYKIKICHLFNIHSEWLCFAIDLSWLWGSSRSHQPWSFGHADERHRLLKHRACLLDRCHCVEDKCSQKGHGAVPILGPKPLCCTCYQYKRPRFPPSPLWQISRPLRAWGACFPQAHSMESPVKSLLYAQDGITDVRVATLCLSTLLRRSRSASSVMYSLFTYLFLRQDLIMTCPRLASTPWSCFHLPSPRITDVSTTLTYCSLILLFCFGMMDALRLTKHFLWFM